MNSKIIRNISSLLIGSLAIWGSPAAFAQEDELSKEKMAALTQGFDKAQKVLRAFLGAANWQEASQFVLDADHLKDTLATHYKEYPWKPIAVQAVRYDGGSEIKGDSVYYVHDFLLLIKGRSRPVAATMVQVGDDYKLDWELFSQAYNNSFEDFLKGEKSGERIFRLSIQRGVALDEHEKLGLKGGVLRLRAGARPGLYYPGDLFVAASSEVGKKVQELVPWEFGEPYRVTVKWNKSHGGFAEVVGFQGLNFSTPSMFD